MNAISTEIVAIAMAPVITLKGRGKAKREGAYMQIAPLSFVENLSRAETIDNLRIALGASPSEAETKTAQTEWIIGRVAARLGASDFPKECREDADKLEFARKLVTNYAAPPKEGSKPRALRAGQLGRRSPTQHKVVRAAEEAWSLVKAELGLGAARTLKEKNAKQQAKAKRSTNNNPVRGDGKSDKGAAPDHSQLVAKPDKAASQEAACQHIVTQASALLAFANKNAALLPTDFGMAVQAFKSAVSKAMNAHEERKAAAAK